MQPNGGWGRGAQGLFLGLGAGGTDRLHFLGKFTNQRCMHVSVYHASRANF